jgi:hypothetical protein
LSEPARRPDIIHVVQHGKFISDFARLVDERLTPSRHHYFFVHAGEQFTVDTSSRVTRNGDFRSSFALMFALALALNRARAIVLHGLFDSRLILLLALQPWLWRRCHWMIWGGDLYAATLDERTWRWRLKEFAKRPVIKRIGALLTYVSGDVELARSSYGAKGIHRDCLLYPSNALSPFDAAAEEHDGVNVLVGNSADPGNRHELVFASLVPMFAQCGRIFVPLSYGDRAYADRIEALGRQLFGTKFIVLRDFMAYDAYLRLLASIDVAVFNHERQQGMGNIIVLLSLGKTVYVNPRTTTWSMASSLGLKLGDADHVSLERFADRDLKRNMDIVRAEFSRDKLSRQLRDILEV